MDRKSWADDAIPDVSKGSDVVGIGQRFVRKVPVATQEHGEKRTVGRKPEAAGKS